MPTIDKLTEYGPGPWVDEPDHEVWEAHGLPCMIHRGPMGALCGYAAVPPGHPFHGLNYSSRVPVADRGAVPLTETSSPMAVLVEATQEDDGRVSLDVLLQVHGGLTYASACQGELCHTPKAGEPDAVWWFGFDCGHYMDITPGLLAALRKLEPPMLRDPMPGTYRDIAYVRAETEELAAQLAAAGTPETHSPPPADGP